VIFSNPFDLLVCRLNYNNTSIGGGHAAPSE
jgi:hypothetical protein